MLRLHVGQVHVGAANAARIPLHHHVAVLAGKRLVVEQFNPAQPVVVQAGAAHHLRSGRSVLEAADRLGDNDQPVVVDPLQAVDGFPHNLPLDPHEAGVLGGHLFHIVVRRPAERLGKGSRQLLRVLHVGRINRKGSGNDVGCKQIAVAVVDGPPLRLERYLRLVLPPRLLRIVLSLHYLQREEPGEQAENGKEEQAAGHVQPPRIAAGTAATGSGRSLLWCGFLHRIRSVLRFRSSRNLSLFLFSISPRCWRRSLLRHLSAAGLPEGPPAAPCQALQPGP